MAKEDTYTVITASDGDTHIEVITKAELLKRMNEDEYCCYDRILDKIPVEHSGDTNYWGDGSTLILKGSEVVVPKAVRTVVEFEVD